MGQTDRWLLAWGLGYVAVGGASLLVPVYALTLGGDAFVVGLLAATAAFAGVPAALVVGRLGDRPGYHRSVVTAAMLTVAATLGTAPFVDSSGSLLVLNTLLWCAVAAATPICNLVVVGGRPAETWDDRLSKLNAFQGYGWVLGLGLGMVWLVAAPQPSGAAQRSLALVFAAAAGLSAAAIWRVFDATASPPATKRFGARFDRFVRRDLGAGRIIRLNPPGSGRLVWSLRRLDQGLVMTAFSGPLGVFLLGTAAFAAGSAAFWAPMPAYLDGQGLSSSGIFLLFLVANLGSALMYGQVSAIEPRLGADRLQLGGIASRGLLFPAALLLGGAGIMVGGILFLVGVSWALVAVTAPLLITRLVPANRRGAILATYTAVTSAGTGVGGVVGGAIATMGGYGLTFTLAAGAVILGAVFVWRGLDVARSRGAISLDGSPHGK